MIDPTAVTKVTETIRLYPVVTNATRHLFSDKATASELVDDGKRITTAPIKSNHPKGFDLIAVCQQGGDVVLNPRITVSSLVLELEHDVLHFDVTGVPELAYIGSVLSDYPCFQLNNPNLHLRVKNASLDPACKEYIDLSDVINLDMDLTIQLSVFSLLNPVTGACAFHSSIGGIYRLRDKFGADYSHDDSLYQKLSEKIKKAKVSFELSVYATKSKLNVAY